MQKSLDGVTAQIGELRAEAKADKAELKADIAELRAEVKADIAGVNARLDRQADQIVDVRTQVATLSERMARVEERVGIPAEPVVTA